ncbi:hypothetical protein EZV62_008401 [Acer yangbiense]|uniref:Uncharacterized protein n=1 Tax=Acer yangbiense TaxID=1000413 RepID=A0A5C7IFC0_9ROSI|nr:hypothetical protein EZV62_008401 [Acer yangbiense]
MGIWDYISSTTDSINRNAPDLTSVKGLCPSTCPSSYNNRRAAVTIIHDAVREGGSTVYDIVSQLILGEKKPKEYKDIKELKDKVRQMEHELNDYKRLLEQHEMRRLIMELKTNKTLGLNRKPEDVIRFFTKPEDAYRFLFTKPKVASKQYLNDLIIARGVKPK